MRDFHHHPAPRFGEMLRKIKAEKHGDRTMRGENKPDTKMEDMPKPEKGGSKGNRPGKASHPSGTSKHDKHHVKGKVREVHASAVHGGHRVDIHYHGGKHEEHFHPTTGAAKKHMSRAMQNMEPEPDADDAGSMARML